MKDATVRTISCPSQNLRYFFAGSLSCDHDSCFKFSPLLNRFLQLLLVLMLITGAVINSVQAREPSTISLDAEDKTWLAAHQTIRIGVDADYAPYSFVAQDGSYQGVVPDFLDRISKILGVRFEIVANLTWPQILQGANDRSLDMIATVVRTAEREKFLHFTDIYIPTPLVIMTRKDNDHINAAEDVNGLTIALVKDYSSSRKVIREHPSVKQYQVDTSLAGLRAVAIGKADAYIGVLGVSTFLARKHGIHNLKVAGPYEMEINGQRIGVRKDWPELVSILDKSFKAIPEAERISILNKWIPIDGTSKKQSQLNLTDTEKRWLNEHEEIRLAIDPAFAPVEFIDERGNYSGISAEYVQRLRAKLGISIHVLQEISWSQALERAKKGEIDMFAAITPTDERKEYLEFSKPYFTYPVVIYTRNDAHIISGINSLLHKKVTVVRDYAVHEMIRQHHPELDVIAMDSIHDGLSAVSTGSADAFIGDIATATFMIRKFNLTNLKIAAPVDFDIKGHAFAVRKDWPELISIINKALGTISAEEHLGISRKWVEIEVEKFPRYWIWVAVVAACLSIIFVVTSTFLRIQVRRRTTELRHNNELLEKENRDRQNAEMALIESEKRLFQFFHATFEMVFFHENGRILDANPAVMKVTGFEQEEIIGKNLLEFVSDGSKEYVISKMSEGGVESYEARIITKKGEVIPVDIHAANIEIAGHKARVVSLRDITERKKSEEALQRAYDLLEVKVEERTAELKLANIRLKELDELKSMFIASVSHELRTPLNSIIGFSSIMMNHTFGDLSEKYQDYITRINKSGQHLLSLITDIIDISKIESGHIDFELSDFELGEVVTEAVENLRPQAESKGLLFDVNIPEGVFLNTDRRRLLQCVLNFISNAIKYSEQGKITILTQDKGKDVVIIIQDTGIGISEVDMSRLFEAFERFESHIQVKAGGTGLGLYLTKKITTEILQGEVDAESTLGKGSIFRIRIPKILQQSSAKLVDGAGA